MLNEGVVLIRLGDFLSEQKPKLAGAGRCLFSVLADPMWYFWGLWHPFSDILAFDYGAGTVRFGTNLDPAEARQIVALLKKRFGQYMADGKVEVGS